MDWGLQRLDAKLGGKDLVKAAHGEKKTAVGEPGRQGWRWWDDVISQSGMMAKIGMFYWHPETGQLNLITHTSSDL